jgi:predicted nucleic acid-binding OB-fold protein
MGGFQLMPLQNQNQTVGVVMITEILDERGKRYGKFKDHAEISQRLKYVVRDRKDALSDDQREALEMICHKIARIINGDPNYADSWIDIAGYAQLVADRLQGVER